jgi:hypothetical protein
MKGAGAASNLEKAQTRGFPCASSHSPVKIAFRMPKAAIAKLLMPSNPAEPDSKAENNTAACATVNPLAKSTSASRSFEMIYSALNRFPGILPSLSRSRMPQFITRLHLRPRVQ